MFDPTSIIRPLARTRHLAERFAYFATIVTAYALVLAALLVCLDVVLRKMGTSPIRGSDEISGYSLALLVSWGAALAVFNGSHIRVDVLYRNLSLKTRAWLDVVAFGSLFVFGAVLAWEGSVLFLDAFVHDSRANTPLRTPLWIPLLLWTVGLAVFSFSSALVFLEGLVRALFRDFEGATSLTIDRDEIPGGGL